MLSFSLRIFTCLFTITGILWASVAGYFWYHCASRQWKWEKAEAVVSKISSDHQDESNIKYAFFTFTDSADGQEITTRSQIGASNPFYHIGEKVEVIYPAHNPQEAIENTFLAQYFLPLSLTFAALMFGALSLASILLRRKLQSKAP